MDYNKLYELWVEKTADNAEITAELQAVAGKDKEIEDRFYRELEFGTAGLRGILGAGTNRMNVYTVGRATQGYCDYLNAKEEKPSVAIAYDSRNKSTLFAETAAAIFAANGIHVYLYRQLMPTPCLSFAVRYFKCSGGVNVTASHNPAAYNGYKVYGSDGCQITEVAAQDILGRIANTDTFAGVKIMALADALEQGAVEYIGQDCIDAYLAAMAGESLLDKNAPRDLKIVYTPLNGAGISCVPECLKQNGFHNITIPEAQKNPDGNFPTCPYPNPEIRQALDVAIACAEEIGAEFVLATDPDCDRVGTAIKANGQYHLITGNQMGVLLLDYICKQKLAAGTMPKDPVAVKTIVTTKLCEKVAEHYGAELRNVLTGFKYIGEQIRSLEEIGQEDRFLLGYEESYGYLTCPSVRDKDAVNASLLICEMVCWYKNQGKNLVEGLQEIYEAFGFYTDKVMNFTFEGAEGFQTMQNLMAALRTDPITEAAGFAVESAVDYKNDETGLPKSNVMQYQLAGGTVATVRPSGTEPKLKVYLSACGKTAEDSAAVVASLEAFFNGWIEAHK
ncbi:MAG: phospho-sugar mutase [Oscillospiraceae bacterium]|nr:phospho-sugar mutase [Oscillospiraceae bacterium]